MNNTMCESHTSRITEVLNVQIKLTIQQVDEGVLRIWTELDNNQDMLKRSILVLSKIIAVNF
jgi:hypothetical protein